MKCVETRLGTQEAEDVTAGQRDGVEGRVEADWALVPGPGPALGLGDANPGQQVRHHGGALRVPGQPRPLGVLARQRRVIILLLVFVLLIADDDGRGAEPGELRGGVGGAGHDQG